MTTSRLVLVLGGNGKTGRRIVSRLQQAGVPVRVGSRSGAVPFAWEDPATWPAALGCVSAAYIAYAPDLAAPGATDRVRRLCATAADAGVQRLVLLSGRGEEEAQRSEQVVRDSGLAWTVLRASWFAQNFSEGFLLDLVLAGVISLPVDGVREPFVDVEDIAELATEALTGDAHDGQTYELTGPRLLSFDEAVQEVARATGREVRLEPLPVADWAAALTAHGVPAEEVQLLTYLFTEVLDGRGESLADGVRRGLGREPADFADYVARTAATGVWEVAS